MLEDRALTTPIRYLLFFAGEVNAVLDVTLDNVTLSATATVDQPTRLPRDEIHLGLHWQMRF